MIGFEPVPFSWQVGCRVLFIGDQKSTLEVKIPEAMGIFGKLLDSDGDGKLDDQIVSMGAGLLSGLFKKI